jgi:SAM-dependent methyltransferase
MNWTTTRNGLVSASNISYYDKIADRYDAQLNGDDTNAIIRNHVAKAFINRVKSGYVLDFGGCTGLDLGWLVRHRYDIIFCEPSAAMRRKAIERMEMEFPGSSVLFLDGDKTDFRNWEGEFPLKQRINAVLANFAVFNCIPDIHLLFGKLALTLVPGGVVTALVLDSRLKKRLRGNLKGTVISFFSGLPVEVIIDFKGNRQLVYLHTIRSIRKAALDNFHLISQEHLHEFGFSLIHLVKK